MILSDISVTRPVFATVISLLLVAFGLVAFSNLPLRQYPDIDPPVVSVETAYPGASADVVETRITELIEDRIAGVEGIRYIVSQSEDGESDITIEFDVGVDIDAAANDVRDRIGGIVDNLPTEADPPEIRKVNSDDDVILWLSLASPDLTILELSDYARRHIQDRFSVLPGVARVRVGGGLNYAMRIWLDRVALAARGLTAADVEAALRRENVELPAGTVESRAVQFSARVARGYRTAEDFRSLVVDSGDNGYLVRLGDVARVEREAAETRLMFRGNGLPRVGIGIIKQSQANTLEVAEAAKALAARLSPTLPNGMSLTESYDTSVFISSAVNEVFKTLGIAIALVVLVIFLFLGSMRAMLVPAVTVPVSVIAAFIVLYALGYSINLLTLLALVLGIGLIVDDAIVVLENIHRRIQEGETPLVAAFEGARQVGFAVIATTLVLLAVFVPITFIQGDIGRLFTEFAVTISAAVVFSTLVALTLSTMLASQVLKRTERPTALVRGIDRLFERLRQGYAGVLRRVVRARWLAVPVILALIPAIALLYRATPQEFTPKEDRGAFFVFVSGPEGATYDYMLEYMDEIEARLMRLVDNGEMKLLLVRAPRGFGNMEVFNTGFVIAVLSDWSERRSAWPIMAEVRRDLGELPGVRAFPVMRQGLGGRARKPVQFVLGGGTFEELAAWRDIINARIERDNPGLEGMDWDYEETKPQLLIEIDRDRAGDLGVNVETIGRTLETMLGSRRVTTFQDGGEEYDVILEGERSAHSSPQDVTNIYVRSDRSDALIPLSNLIQITETASANELNRYNRVRAITLEANLSDGLPLGQALAYLERITREELPDSASIDYKGQSLDFKSSGGSLLFVFALGALVVFLVLAAQFESFVHPLVIMLSVPAAIGGALAGMLLTDGSLNIYTQIGLIMLIGLAAKNGILIVEFINQLREQGHAFEDAIVEAASVRLRPIVMTSLTTAAGAIPLVISFGAGAETRSAIGIVVLSGVAVSTLVSLFLIPAMYGLLARDTPAMGAVRRRLERERAGTGLTGDAQPAE